MTFPVLFPSSDPGSPIISRFKFISEWIGIIVSSIGILVLIGWACDIALLRSLYPGLAPMKMDTALAIVLMGASLWLLQTKQVGHGMHRIGYGCALVLVLIGGYRIGAYLMSWESGERPLFQASQDLFSIAYPFHMAPIIALTFLVMGLSLLLLDVEIRRGHRPFQFLVLIAGIIASLALTGYVYGISTSQNVLIAFPSMEPHTSVIIGMACFGILFARPAAGPMLILSSKRLGGSTARRLVFIGIVIPLMVDALALAGVQTGLYDRNMGSALHAVVIINVLILLALVISRSLERIDIERRKALETLQQSEVRYRRLFETAKDGILIIDATTGQFIDVNPFLSELLGYSHEEFVEKKLWEVESFKEIVDCKTAFLEMHCARHEDNAYWREIRLTTKYGHRINAEVLCNSYLANNKKVIQYNIRDITEQTQAKETSIHMLENLEETTGQLREKTERLEIVSELNRTISSSLKFEELFQTFVEMASRVVSFDCTRIIKLDDSGERMRVLVRWPESKSSVHKPLVSIKGTILEHILAAQQPSIERDIREQGELPPSELLCGNMRSRVMLPLITKDRIIGLLTFCSRQPGAYTEQDLDILIPLAEQMAIAVENSRLYEVAQKAYDDLRQSQQSALQQERLRALGQMASGIVHDINNMLSSVVGYSELLLRTQELSEKSRRYVRNIRRAGDDITETVVRMREFYRKRDEKEFSMRIRLNSLVEQVIDLTRAKWRDLPQEHGVTIDIQTDLQEDMPCMPGVESELREVLTNLIFNAVDAMPTGGTMTIRTRAALSADGTPFHVSLEVTDTGIGMDAQTKQHCLEPFFSTKGEAGTGLGLAMAFGAIQRHKGSITIESAVGYGTTIRLVFPLSGEDVLQESSAARDVEKISDRSFQILYIDDEPRMRELVKEMLTSDGHTVEVVDGGRAGLDTFFAAQHHNKKFEVVMTDLGMPQVDGREVARKIKEESPTTPVMLLTGWGSRMKADGDIPPEVDMVVSKPPHLDELRRALAQID